MLQNIIYFPVHLYLFLLLTTSTFALEAQNYFGDLCSGNWSGMMHLYKKGQITDSIPVTIEIKKINPDNSWKWKTSYNTNADKIVKDYTLKLIDTITGHYIIDEGNGIELSCYQFEHKLYSTFEVGGKILTANYELNQDTLFFEVTSSTKQQVTSDGSVANYTIEHLQKVKFRKNKY